MSRYIDLFESGELERILLDCTLCPHCCRVASTGRSTVRGNIPISNEGPRLKSMIKL